MVWKGRYLFRTVRLLLPTMRFPVKTLFFHMTALAMISACVAPFLRLKHPEVTFVFPAAVYSFFYAFQVAKRLDSTFDHTCRVGGKAGLLATLIIFLPGSLLYNLEFLMMVEWWVYMIFVLCLCWAIGVCMGVLCDILHLLTTHSSLRRWKIEEEPMDFTDE